MSDKQIKRIPYGLSSYDMLVRQHCYYIDKTGYLKTIENAGNYLFFIRPRRFGKSLFLSMMEGYYDTFYKDRFEELFKGTTIYDQPTDERGQYLVLTLNFSVVEPALDKVEASFLNHVRVTAWSFVKKYSDSFAAADLRHYLDTIEKNQSASDILSTLFQLCRDSGRRLYILIDEYDNFANTILTTAGKTAYQDLTHGEGFYRSFFNVLKSGTGGMGAPVKRLFITGVSPVTMDDVTSGFNIGKNISLEPAVNRMLGFTKDEVTEMIAYYTGTGLMEPPADLPAIMTQWYGNYRFTGEDDVTLFNSDMVLYFVDKYLSGKKLPDELIDRNVRIDYGKLRHLILVDRGKGKTTNGNFDRLKDIIENGGTVSKIVDGFPLEKLTDRENFISLMFYFGLLTIQGVELDERVLTIPNETVRRLFYDYIREAYEETDVFAVDLSTYNRLMHGMALRGEWKPLFDYITGRMRESMSLRDLVTGEKSIQAFLNVYLGLSSLYIIHTEKEMNKGYADLIMEPFLARFDTLKYSYLLEIKYTKAGRNAEDPEIQRLKKDAEKQFQNYALNGSFAKTVEKTTLIKLVLIFSGHDLLYIGHAVHAPSC